jgi:hypothetical protein
LIGGIAISFIGDVEVVIAVVVVVPLIVVDVIVAVVVDDDDDPLVAVSHLDVDGWGWRR